MFPAIANREKNLTDRDYEIFYLMATFGGKTYVEVLAATAWLGHANAHQQVRNRLGRLIRQYDAISFRQTGLTRPRNAYIVNQNTRNLIQNAWGINVTTAINVAPMTIHHNIMEQIAFYWLAKIGKAPQRTIVRDWSAKGYYHTPDMVYEHDKGLVYVEIERNVKKASEQNRIFVNMHKDKVYRILYIVEDEKKMYSFARSLPRDERLMITHLDALVAAAQNGKIGAKKQSVLLNEDPKNKKD